MVPIYSSDVAFWFSVVLICVAPDMLTHYTFEKKIFFENFFFLKFFFFEIFKKFFSSNLAELCSEKVIFKNRKKKILKKNFCGHDFFFQNCNKIKKNRQIK